MSQEVGIPPYWDFCPAKETLFLSWEKVHILTHHYLHALLTEQLNRSGCCGEGDPASMGLHIPG